MYLVAPKSIFNVGTFPTLLITSTKDSIAILILSTKSNFEETIPVKAEILASEGTNKNSNKSPNSSINL